MTVEPRYRRIIPSDSSGNEYNSSNPLPVEATLNVGDIEIGAVEIKDGETDTRLKVKSDGTDNAAVVTQNSQPLPTGAATQTTLAALEGKDFATSTKQLPDDHNVNVSNFPVTQQVAAISWPLPSGA